MQTAKLFKIALLCVIPAFVLVSCGGEEQKNNNDVVIDQQPIEDEELQSSFLPSPLQVAMIFDKSGLEFDPSLVNSANNVQKYTTKFEKSLNFGVYSADLAYSVLNEKSKEATKTLKVVKELSAEIGLSTVFDSEDIMTRFEKNISNKDSVLDLLVIIEEKTDDYIEENGEHELGAVMFAGAWVEGMYIGARSAIKDQKKNKELGNKLSEQMIICGNIIKELETKAQKTSEIDKLIADIKAINDLYHGFESVKKMEGDAAYDVSLTEDEMNQLTGKIIDLRTSIVKD